MAGYKVLISGKHKLIIDDIYNHLGSEHVLLTSSFRFVDLVNHVNVFRPDVFIICLNGETREELSVLVELKRLLTRDEVVVFVIGSYDENKFFEECVTYMADETFERPITAEKLDENIQKYMDERKKHHEQDAVIREEAQKVKEEDRRKLILAIDDDPLMLKVVKEQLHEKYDVATAINSGVAYKFITSKKPDMILLDYEMPGEDGYTVLKKLRSVPVLATVPVVFLTGLKDKEKIRQILELKPQGYLMKPIDKDQLLGMVEKFIG